jgi:hypothetical protein
MEDYWYENKHLLKPEDVFIDIYGNIIKLDRRVPGDGTKWYVADWTGKYWAYEDSTIEPGELCYREDDPVLTQML